MKKEDNPELFEEYRKRYLKEPRTIQMAMDNNMTVEEMAERMSVATDVFEVETKTLITEYKPMEFVWERTKEIEKALQYGMYFSALLIALTLPDICGKAEYPELKDKPDGQAYKKWFDEYITKENNFGDEENTLCFNGYMCYKARCQMVHGEIQSLERIPNGKNSKLIKEKGYKNIKFKFSKNTSSKVMNVSQAGSKTLIVKLSIEDICRQIQRTAEICYRKFEDKSLFNDGVIIFCN